MQGTILQISNRKCKDTTHIRSLDMEPIQDTSTPLRKTKIRLFQGQIIHIMDIIRDIKGSLKTHTHKIHLEVLRVDRHMAVIFLAILPIQQIVQILHKIYLLRNGILQQLISSPE